LRLPPPGAPPVDDPLEPGLLGLEVPVPGSPLLGAPAPGMPVPGLPVPGIGEPGPVAPGLVGAPAPGMPAPGAWARTTVGVNRNAPRRTKVVVFMFQREFKTRTKRNHH